MRHIIDDFKDVTLSTYRDMGGIWGISAMFAITLGIGAWIISEDEKREKKYSNIEDGDLLFDLPSEEEKEDIIGILSPLISSYYVDDRREHAKYSETPEYHVVGYLFSGENGEFPGRCSAQISVLPGYEQIERKPIITGVDHCIPDDLSNAYMNFSARLMDDQGNIHEYSSPVILSSIVSFPDYNENRLWPWHDTEHFESPFMAILENPLPFDVDPFVIDTEWNGRKGTNIISLGYSSDRHGLTYDNNCVTGSKVSKLDYSFEDICHNSVGSSGGAFTPVDDKLRLIAVNSKATAYAIRGDGVGKAVTFPSRDDYDYSSIPWLRVAKPRP